MLKSNNIELRELIFEICWDLFRVSRNKLIPTKESYNGGRKKGTKNIDIFTRYLIINWLNENQQLVRREIGNIFNMDHSTISCAIKKSNILVQNRDLDFCIMLDKFNVALSKRGIETVKCDTQIQKGLKIKLTKEEKYHLRLMLFHNIPMSVLAKHFHVSLHVIRKFKNELENDIK